MERIGKEWLWRRDSLIPRKELEKVKTKENADELFIYLFDQ